MKKKIQTTENLKNMISEECRISEEDLDMVSGGRQKSEKKTKKFKEKRKDQGDAVRGFLRFLIGD